MSQYEGKMYCDNREEWFKTTTKSSNESPLQFGDESTQEQRSGFRKNGKNLQKSRKTSKQNEFTVQSRSNSKADHSSPSRSASRSLSTASRSRSRSNNQKNSRKRKLQQESERESSARHGWRDSRTRYRRENIERFKWNKKKNERSRSPTYDSEEEYRRSRSRERARRRKQYETIQKYCRINGESQVFWDGFQWVKKGDGDGLNYDQQMNATRRARRLHVGNLPLNSDVTEEDFRLHLWKVMREKNLCTAADKCPILHVWFARDRGGSYGFVEMNSVEDAHAVLSLDGFIWNGVPIRVNRPTDWKKYVNETAFGAIADTSGLALAESLAAAAQQAISTGNTSGLASLISKLPTDQQQSVATLIQQQQVAAQKPVQLPMELVQCQIEAELLKGSPSKIVRIVRPVEEIESDENYDEILQDIMTECKKFGGILSALIVRPNMEKEVPIAESGDVYFEYATSKQVDAAIIGLSGRIYDGRPLQIERFNDLVWTQSFKKYSQNILGDILREHI